MERTLSSEVGQRVGERVTVAGWLHAVRNLGGLTFAVVRDRAGLVQAVTENNADADLLRGLGPESVLTVSGLVALEPRAPGGVEVRAERICHVAPVGESLPVQLNKREVTAGLDVLLDHRAVSLRAPAARATFRVQAEVAASFAEFLASQGFTRIHTPKLVCAGAEGGADIFSVQYFEQRAYLAQSPQFYKQIMVGVFERVYEVGPVFRAEPHDTVRHINEYVSLDAEMGFIRDHRDVMDVLSRVIRGIVVHLQTLYAPEMALLDVKLPVIPEQIPSIYFPDAQQLILDLHGEDARGEPDLAPQHERWLGEWAKEKYGSDFLFVTGYPMVKRPFYTHPNPDDPRYSNSFDLLFRGTELVTGGQRLHLYQDYLDAAARAGIKDLKPFETYFETFKFGMPPHGGFAIGLERFIMQLLGLDNIRLATLFPRDLTRLAP